jgi:hypothetical protein
MLFIQVFLTSEKRSGCEIQSLENGKGNLCPASNETELGNDRVDEGLSYLSL